MAGGAVRHVDVFADLADHIAKLVERVASQSEDLLPTWSMRSVVDAVWAMRGVVLIVAVTVVAEVGDFSRFQNPRELMAYFGQVPSEQSWGASAHRGRCHQSRQ
jgi:transposase